MKFTIAVHGSPYGSTSHQHALAFCHASVAAGHAVERVFFYHDGVYGALSTTVTPQDQVDVTHAWQDLSKTESIELCVCIANALKRGVLDPNEAERYETGVPTMAPGFQIVGLGLLVDAITSSDRYVECPA
jgi:tRNA 2-thiouridine synthesizing protein D